jgi:quinol monooxygenase YgiN
MIYSVYIIKVNKSQADSIDSLLQLFTQRTRYIPGCLKSETWRNNESSDTMVFEKWETSEDLIRHISSPRYKRLLAALELSMGEPEICFFECKNCRGLDFVEEILIRNNENQNEKTSIDN